MAKKWSKRAFVAQISCPKKKEYKLRVFCCPELKRSALNFFKKLRDFMKLRDQTSKITKKIGPLIGQPTVL